VKILVLNAGSSSQKSRLYDLGDSLPEEPPEPLWEANADWTAQQGKVELALKGGGQRESVEQSLAMGGRDDVLRHMLATLWSGPTRVVDGPREIGMVGHRVVHGGPDYHRTTRITAEVKTAIEQYAPFAPEHNPANLAGIRIAEELLPEAAQLAVFDTSFHRQIPQAAAVYPGPYAWFERGIHRYGFHGINHQYCMLRAAHLLGRSPNELRLITCHLGNGCSLAAIRQGRSIETTMGFTPLEGLMMGSRAGSVDPGILLYLLQHEGYTPQQLDEMLNKQSGLKGISGLSSDMRVILQKRSEGNERANLAFEMFVHRLRASIGAMLAVLGGLDALVFSGGIGENSPEVRAAACEALGMLGLELDAQRNGQVGKDQDIASPVSAVRVLVIQAEEDWMIARECWDQALSAT
jgi:acetate kinase